MLLPMIVDGLYGMCGVVIPNNVGFARLALVFSDLLINMRI